MKINKFVVKKFGFTLLEVMVAVGLVSIISIFTMKMFQNMNKATKTVAQNYEVTSALNSVRGFLADPASCKASFPEKKTSGDNLILVNSAGDEIYKSGTGFAEQVRIDSIVMGDLIEGDLYFINVTFGRNADRYSTIQITKRININFYFDTNGTTVRNCFAAASGGVDTIWSNVANGVSFPASNNPPNYVGIGEGNPNYFLDIFHPGVSGANDGRNGTSINLTTGGNPPTRTQVGFTHQNGDPDFVVGISAANANKANAKFYIGANFGGAISNQIVLHRNTPNIDLHDDVFIGDRLEETKNTKYQRSSLTVFNLESARITAPGDAEKNPGEFVTARIIGANTINDRSEIGFGTLGDYVSPVSIGYRVNDVESATGWNDNRINSSKGRFYVATRDSTTESSAPTEKLVVDEKGNLGVGVLYPGFVGPNLTRPASWSANTKFLELETDANVTPINIIDGNEPMISMFNRSTEAGIDNNNRWINQTVKDGKFVIESTTINAAMVAQPSRSMLEFKLPTGEAQFGSSVKIGDTPNAVNCSPEIQGTIRYRAMVDTTPGYMEYCNGVEWALYGEASIPVGTWSSSGKMGEFDILNGAQKTIACPEGYGAIGYKGSGGGWSIAGTGWNQQNWWVGNIRFKCAKIKPDLSPDYTKISYTFGDGRFKWDLEKSDTCSDSTPWIIGATAYRDNGANTNIMKSIKFRCGKFDGTGSIEVLSEIGNGNNVSGLTPFYSDPIMCKPNTVQREWVLYTMRSSEIFSGEFNAFVSGIDILCR